MNRRNSIKVLGSMAMLPIQGHWSLKGWNQNVIKKKIPSTGELLPCVGLGTWLTFDIASSNISELKERREILQILLAQGGKVVDSSPMYGRSEMIVGKAKNSLKTPDKLFLSTKVWTSGKQSGINQIRSSAEKMDTKQLDLVEVHNLVDWKTHLTTLMDMKEHGEIRYIGITHYLEHAYEAMGKIIKQYPIDFIQVNYNVANQAAGERLLPAAMDMGKAVLINRPFQGGSVFRKTSKPLPSFATDFGCASWAQLCLKFVTSHPAVTCAIPGTSQSIHMLENIQTAHSRLLNTKERITVTKAFNI